MKRIFIVMLALILTVGATAQSYKSAIGLKLGYNMALTYKVNMSESNAIDLNLNLDAFSGVFGLAAQGFYLWSFPIIDNLNWYVGPGATVGMYFGAASTFLLTVNAEIGIEYKIPTVPVAISLDYTPGVGLIGGGFHPSYYGGGLGVKYTF